MTPHASSEPSHFRVTFFFGPNPVDNRPDLSYCVFNVKKRSWKGGVQVTVELSHDQISRLCEQIAYRDWFTRMLEQVSPEEKEPVLQRIDDLFIQALCACKLDLAMQKGLEQANQTLAADRLTLELDRATKESPARITDYVKAELDLRIEP